MSLFVPYHPSVDEINIHSGDVLEMLHQEDLSPDNPVVTDTLCVFGQLDELSDIRGGYILFDEVEVFQNEGRIGIKDRELKPGGRICSYLHNARQMAVLICTAGEVFSQKTIEYNQQGDYLKGYIVDTLGSIVVEKAMDYIQSKLEEQMWTEGLKITNRYSPGYCNWEVNDQRSLFSLLSGNTCDISLTGSCLMVPVKSVSAIIGIGEEVHKSEYGCDICKNSTCTFRKVKNKQNLSLNTI